MYVKKIWITGASGRLGATLYRYLDPLELEILTTDRNIVDITNIREVNKYAERIRPDIIINCSGFSSRNYCESNPDDAYRLNGIGAKNIAIASRKAKAKLVHLSTGDVFEGNSIKAYREIDPVNPMNVYGKSKYFGEEMVRTFAPRHFIIRVSRLYSKENEFVESIINEAKTKGEVLVPKNQFASPTPAYELAKFILYLIDTREYGTYHASCEGVCSRKKFAEKVLEFSGMNDICVKEVERENESEYKAQYLALENYILKLTGAYKFKNWEEALEDYIKKEV